MSVLVVPDAVGSMLTPRLLQLLTAIQRQAADVPRVFGVPDIDEYLQSVENALNSSSDSVNSCQKGPSSIIEITDTKTGSGKTHVLYHMITLSTLPQTHGDISVGGKASAVLLFDVDASFNLQRLSEVMEGHIRSCCQPAHTITEAEISVLVKDAMEHIHLYRPNSSEELELMLSNAVPYLLGTGNHHSGDRRLDAILIDSLSACHWQDQALALGLDENPEVNLSKSKMKERYAKIQGHLHSFRRQTGAFVIVTTWGLRRQQKRQSRGEYTDTPVSLLPEAWGSTLASIRIVVSRCPGAPPFPRAIDWAEALARKSEHRSAVLQAGFIGIFDIKNLPPEVQARVRTSVSGFKYHINQDGIKFAHA